MTAEIKINHKRRRNTESRNDKLFAYYIVLLDRYYPYVSKGHKGYLYGEVGKKFSLSPHEAGRILANKLKDYGYDSEKLKELAPEIIKRFKPKNTNEEVKFLLELSDNLIAMSQSIKKYIDNQ